ncbi:hypothetical protein LTR81_024153 [Elasticomyces elasticus]
MDLSDYLCQNEITQLNRVFELSLQHDSSLVSLVFWTGISPDLAKDWAHRNDLKTLTMAMGSLYTDNNRRSQKFTESWSKYMKGASWIFAQHACHDRNAIVLTNVPPEVYSTREHSTYCEIEEPILKGFEADRHAIQIDYVHPTVPGAKCFRYQIWPDNRSSEWLTFIESIADKQIALKCTTAPHHESKKISTVIPFVAYGEDRKQEIAREKKAAKRLKVAREQQASEEKKKAAKRLKAEREQQVARGKKAAKRLKAEQEQQAAREKKAAKRVKAEKES